MSWWEPWAAGRPGLLGSPPPLSLMEPEGHRDWSLPSISGWEHWGAPQSKQLLGRSGA